MGFGNNKASGFTIPLVEVSQSLRLLKALWLLNLAFTERGTTQLQTKYALEARDLIVLSYIAWGDMNSPSALVKELQLPKYVVSRCVEKLVRLGCIERQFDATDARRTFFKLTRTGSSQHLAAINEFQKTVYPVLAELGERTTERMVKDLEQLVGVLGAEKEMKGQS